jgi:hypothetical protein
MYNGKSEESTLDHHDFSAANIGLLCGAESGCTAIAATTSEADECLSGQIEPTPTIWCQAK